MTADLLETYLAAQRVFGDRVHAVTEEQWRAGTPCEEWTVADLVGHLVEENLWAAPLLHGLDLDAAEKVVKGGRSLPVDGGVGANRAQEWDEAAAAAADAFSADGALDRDVALSRGSTPARDYITEMIFDLVVHAWDLGRAIDFPEPIPAELADRLYPEAKKFGDLSSTGLFHAPVDVAEDAPSLDKLVALTGRDPR
ncbi:MAG TPA: TIGR03086 family metal-binding protein [Jatrophihabitans sp.]|jgi:uncharacterized protein (TIGR03086 family)|nr:TIGR03086 family metal-binding protein [Jatrophihabitans sp.]